jgi:short-subunit dehydrogenase
VPARFALRETVGRLGLPPEVVEDIGFPSTYGAHLTQEALAGSGIHVPDLDSYADRIWSFWEERLDESLARDEHTVEALRGRTVVITGASSGIGEVTAHKVAQAGAVPVLVARNEDALQATKAAIEDRGGTAYAFACDLTDLAAVDDLTHRLTTEVGTVDFLVNNAGRSIRRSVELSEGRFDDVEGTMQVNYFGTVRLVMGLLPAMRAQQHGHVVNVSTTAVVTSPPGFSAYVASKAALDAWSNVVASEVAEDGITFSTVHLPLVRTPMAGDTEMHDRFPAITPAQAAELIVRALVDRPQQIDTAVGTLGAVAHTLAPRAVSRVQQLLLARPTRGVHS